MDTNSVTTEDCGSGGLPLKYETRDHSLPGKLQYNESTYTVKLEKTI
jgi:hypothetical protein